MIQDMMEISKLQPSKGEQRGREKSSERLGGFYEHQESHRFQGG